MKKFVIIYGTGSYDSYINHYYTVLGSSKRQIKEELKRAISELEENNERVRDHLSKKPTKHVSSKEYQEWFNIWTEMNNNGQGLKHSLEVFGGSIEYEDGLKVKHMEILELDEWFEQAKVNNERY